MTRIGSRVSRRILRNTPLLQHSTTPLLRFNVMRKFYALLSREVRGYFHSPIAYIVLIFFLIVNGIDFYFQISFMNQRQVQYTVQEAFFNSVFFWFAFVLIFPLITMHLFLRNYTAFFPRSGSVHSARCKLRNARPAGVLLCDRTYGDVLAWSDRYTANHSLREHDHRDAGAHAPRISIPQMEALSDG